MLSDLSLAALFALNRRAKHAATQCGMQITGLLSEHLDPLVTAGWLSTSKGQSMNGVRNSGKTYHLTATGIALCEQLVRITQNLAVHQLAGTVPSLPVPTASHLASASLV